MFSCDNNNFVTATTPKTRNYKYDIFCDFDNGHSVNNNIHDPFDADTSATMSTQTACFDTFVYLDNNFNIDALIDFRINMGNKYKDDIDSYA